MGVSTGCIRSPEKIYAGRGEILTIAVTSPEEVERVYYAEKGLPPFVVTPQPFVVSPREQGATLVVVKARVINQKSNKVTLSLDSESAQLQDSDGRFFPALNYTEMSAPATGGPPDKYPHTPFLWGLVELGQGFEVTGWFIFEVPVNTEFMDFLWDDVESIRVPYR